MVVYAYSQSPGIAFRVALRQHLSCGSSACV